MPEVLITAKADAAEDALAAIRQVLEDISHIEYQLGFPTEAAWLRVTRNGVNVRVTLSGDQ